MLASKRGTEAPMDFTRDPPRLSFASFSSNIYKTSFHEPSSSETSGSHEQRNEQRPIPSSSSFSKGPPISYTSTSRGGELIHQQRDSSDSSEKEPTMMLRRRLISQTMKGGDQMTINEHDNSHVELERQLEKNKETKTNQNIIPTTGTTTTVTDVSTCNDIPNKKATSSPQDRRCLSSSTSSLSHHLLLPYIISGYLQLFFNCFLVALVLYMTVQFLKTVRRDVELKVEEYQNVILNEIAQCSKHYLDNRCQPGERVPAMDKACNTWYLCMNRDATEISWTKISAETIAEIINGFVEPISYKTMVFFVLFTFGLLFISNLAFGVAKTRTQTFMNHPSPSTFPFPSNSDSSSIRHLIGS
jgi:hypothetical protein